MNPEVLSLQAKHKGGFSQCGASTDIGIFLQDLELGVFQKMRETFCGVICQVLAGVG